MAGFLDVEFDVEPYLLQAGGFRRIVSWGGHSFHHAHSENARENKGEIVLGSNRPAFPEWEGLPGGEARAEGGRGKGEGGNGAGGVSRRVMKADRGSRGTS
jgi:hypothetical protein